MPRVARIRVPVYQETGKHTLYRIEVTTDDGRTRRVERRYRDVLRFHGTLCRAAPHPKLEQFDFPHKSILNTNAEFTKERRRSGSIAASRRVETPSRHLHESSPGEGVVGGLISDFEAVRDGSVRTGDAPQVPGSRLSVETR